MVPLVEFPELVQHYAPFFADVFSAEAFIEFKRYISGLIVSENKTVDGINRLFVTESRNQSSLNRLLTASRFSLTALDAARLALLASLPGTRMKAKGVLSVDDTLLTHYGQEFEQIAKLFDPVSESYVWAHDLVTIHYSDDDTDYPLCFQLWKPVDLAKLEQGLRAAQVPLKASKEALKASDPAKWRGYLLGVWQRRRRQYPELQELYESKLIIAQNLLQQWVAGHPTCQLPVTFDNWFTQPAFCRFLDQTLGLAYVGTLVGNDKVNLKTGQTTLADFAARLKQEHLDAVQAGGQPVFRRITIPYKGEPETYYSYCQTHHIHNFGKQRLVTPALGPQVQVSTIARLIWRTTPPSLSATAWFGRPPAHLHRTCVRRRCRCHAHSPPPLARGSLSRGRQEPVLSGAEGQKGWTSINYGTSAPSNVMSPWSPWCTAYCERPNTTLTFATDFSVNSR